MPDSPAEFHSSELRDRQSPFWKDRELLTSDELKALQGTQNLERFSSARALISGDPDIENLTMDMYEKLFQPFGVVERGYRQMNTIVMGGKLEYPDYLIIPRAMREFSADLVKLFKSADDDPSDVGKVIKVAKKAHDIVYVHPFPDGNGRTARALTHYVLRRLGYGLPFWRYKGRDAYLDAVGEGYNNPPALEAFITEALIVSYRDKEARLKTGPYGDLVDYSKHLREIRETLERHFSSIKHGDVAVV